MMTKQIDISFTPRAGARPMVLVLAAALALAGCASLEDASADTVTGLGGRDSLRTTPEEDLPEAARNCRLPEAWVSRAGSQFIITLPADLYAARDREPAKTRIACVRRWAAGRGLTFTLGAR
jgi:hypothetical protein